MKNIVPVLAVIGALAMGAPAMAQIVNGNNGGNGSPEAPIGTKAGGSNAAMQAPGEGAAMAGAKQNAKDAKAGRMTSTRKRRSTNSVSSGQ